MTSIDVLRRAQGEILNLQAYIAQIEPKAVAFDLLVRTHLGRSLTDTGSRRATVNELEEEIAGLQYAAAKEVEEAAAKEAAKKAKVKKPRKPRTPKPPAEGAQGEQGNDGGGGDPSGEQNAATQGDPGASPPETRRRRGLFAVGTQTGA